MSAIIQHTNGNVLLQRTAIVDETLNRVSKLTKITNLVMTQEDEQAGMIGFRIWGNKGRLWKSLLYVSLL
jgi:hypothetical protein